MKRTFPFVVGVMYALAGCAAAGDPKLSRGAPVILSVNSATFVVGSPGSFTVRATGNPTPSLTETGPLPNGITFTDNGNETGTLSGIPVPRTAGKYSITFTANNGVGLLPTTQPFTLMVEQPDEAPVITNPNSAAFTAGTAGTFMVMTTGFPTPALTETGALPSGVTFADNANGTATLSGTLAAGTAGTYPLTVSASNRSGTTSQSFTLIVYQAPAIITSNHATFTVGMADTFTVTTTGFPAPVLTETGVLPNGVGFVDNGNGTATLSGTAAAGTGGTYPITVQASSSSGTTSQSFTLTLDQPPAITSPISATFTVGTATTFTVTTTGFPTSALTETGALPSGVTITDNHNGTATLSGTAPAGTGGTYPITVQANSSSGTTSQSFTLVVDQSPAITSPNSATFTAGTIGTFTVTTTGFPAPALTETGGLPNSLTFVDNHNGAATINGTPAAGTGGTYPITVQASSSSGTTSQSFTLTVGQAPAITSPNSASFTAGAAGNFMVTTTGFPTATVAETGALPSGVTFTANGNGTGTLSGTLALGTVGTYSITFTASNGVGATTTQAFTLTVNPANTGPVISSASSTTFVAGAAGNFSVTTTGFPTPALTETGALPSGVTFVDNGNGTATLGGTPAAGSGGTYPVTIKASGSAGSASQSFTLTVNQASAITSTNSAILSVGSSASFAVTTTGFPIAALTETGTLPSGVTFTSNGNGTGTLAGTPAAGTGKIYTITFSASNGVGTAASQVFTLTVGEAPAITSANSAAFGVGTGSTFTVTTTGFPAPALTETGALPSGVTFLDKGNGTATLSGTPAASTGGTYSIIIKATSSSGSASQSFNLSVSQGPAITSPNGTTFTVGTASTFTVTTTGTPTPSLTETGTLPRRVTFADNGDGTGTFAGTPASGAGGTYAIIITVSNASGSTSQNFTFTVHEAPAITSSNSATFAVGVSGAFTVTTTGFPAPALTETGALPSGVTFADNGNGSGRLSGTPANGTARTYPISFTASNGSGAPATQNFALTVSGSSISCGSGRESALKGQYAFLFQGFDGSGPVAIAGTFSADGTGKVASSVGVADINTSAGVQANVSINSSGSSYSVGSDNRGCLTLATGSGTFKYAFSLGTFNTLSVATRGRMIEVDGTGVLGSGSLRLQDPTAFSGAPNGAFNFSISSTQSLSTITPGRFAMAGALTASGGMITSGEADFNLDGGVNGGANGPLAITGGSYKVSSNGRGTLSFTVAGAGTFDSSIYVVTATEFYLIDVDAQSSSNPLFAGVAQGQTGPFTNSSLSNNTVFYTIGLCGGCGPGSTVAPSLSVGVINVPTAGSFKVTGDQNQGGTLTSQSFSGTYTVDSAGRLVLSGGPATYIVYLESNNRGFLLTTGSDVGEGFLDGQSSGSFTNASLTLAYFLGTTDKTEQNVSDISSAVFFDGAGTVSGTTDSAALGSTPSTDTFSQLYSVTNGTGTPGRGTIKTSSGVTTSIFYITAGGKIVLMDAMDSSGLGNPHPAIHIGRD